MRTRDLFGESGNQSERRKFVDVKVSCLEIGLKPYVKMKLTNLRYIDGLVENRDAHAGGAYGRRPCGWREVQVNQQVFLYWNISLNKAKTNSLT